MVLPLERVRPQEEQAALVAKILRLKKKLNAIIVAHNYQLPEVQDVADFVGDSLELSRRSTQVSADTIVFCGVHFMAETAAILNPARTVLLSEGTAGCPMADMIDVPELRRWKERYPEAVVVCYVNSSAAVKAESYICCTSANAVKVVESLPHKQVLFVPDQNLGHYVSTKTQKHIIIYPGYCITHQRVNPEQVRRAKERHPEALVVVHPECTPEVVALADAVLSTSQMLRFVRGSTAKTFLIGTEFGLLHRMKQENPDKTFYAVSTALVCPNMKKTRLESVVITMETGRNIVTVPEEIRLKAKQALDRMLAVS